MVVMTEALLTRWPLVLDDPEQAGWLADQGAPAGYRCPGGEDSVAGAQNRGGGSQVGLDETGGDKDELEALVRDGRRTPLARSQLDQVGTQASGGLVEEGDVPLGRAHAVPPGEEVVTVAPDGEEVVQADAHGLDQSEKGIEGETPVARLRLRDGAGRHTASWARSAWLR